MKELIMDLEKDFANNEYYGTNVWSLEKYRVLNGNIPVLISAPHSVNQFRIDDIRGAEKYTGALARYFNNSIGCYSIFQMFTHADPNSDKEHMYKNAIINLIENLNIKLLIDIHSSEFKEDSKADIDLVTNKRTTLMNDFEIIAEFKDFAKNNNIIVEENNEPNELKENEIIYSASFVGGIPAIRIVINEKSLDINTNEEKVVNICKTIEQFIGNYCKRV